MTVGDRTLRRSRHLTLLAAVSLLACAAVGQAAAYGLAPPYGFSTSTGSFVLPFYQALLTANPIDPSTTVFGDQLYLEFLNNEGNRTVAFSALQYGPGLQNLSYNATFSVVGHGVTVLSVSLPSSSDQRAVYMCIDGGCMTFLHVTPLTLLPSGILNVGGLDILAFGLTAEFGLLLFPLTVLARSLTRKALWTPRFKAWLVAPHIALAFVLLVAFDYQAFDSLFGGLGFVLIPPVFSVLYFLWVLHLFNVAKPVEAFRPEPQAGHALSYYRWRFWVGEMPDGRKVLIGCYWRDWLARLFGHAPTLVSPTREGSKAGLPAEAPVLTMRSETTDERRDRRARAVKRFRQRPGRRDPLEQFTVRAVANSRLDPRERDPPALLYWVNSDGWLNARMPHLSVHRDVKLPPKMGGPDGTTVVEPARTVRKLAFPHYVDTSGEVSDLAAIHYYDVPVAAIGWTTAEKAYRRIEDLRVQNYVLRTTPLVLADESTEVSMDEVFRLLRRERYPLSADEADEETRSQAPKPSKKPDGTGEGEPTPEQQERQRASEGRT